MKTEEEEEDERRKEGDDDEKEMPKKKKKLSAGKRTGPDIQIFYPLLPINVLCSQGRSYPNTWNMMK